MSPGPDGPDPSRPSREALELLKLLSSRGGRGAPVVLTSRQVGDLLGVSQQSASQYLRDLTQLGWIARSPAGRQQGLRVTAAGTQVLRREMAELRRALEGEAPLSLSGSVVSGLGEGRYYLSLPGYMVQIRERLGYSPFPGTLNVKLTAPDLSRLAEVKALDGVRLDGFQDQGRTFGGATCYASLLRGRSCHLIFPDRTHYSDVAEFIAPVELRRVLHLKDDDRVTMEIGVADRARRGRGG